MEERVYFERLRDDEWYDEVRIKVVPRYKTSELSGDEWRISAKIEILRKGIVIAERRLGNMGYACDFLKATIHEMSDKGVDNPEIFDTFCFQPGCSQPGVVEYEMLNEYYPNTGDVKPKTQWTGSLRRRFCADHAIRGDCGLDDSDRNYRLISAPEGWQARASLGAQIAEPPKEG